MFNPKNKRKMETAKEILEKRIEFYENLLKVYRKLSDDSSVSYSRQERTIDNILDKLSELYKERERFN